MLLFFVQAEDGIRYLVRSRGLGDVYKRQGAIMEAIVSSNAGRLPWGEDHHSVYRKLLNHRISLAAICEDLSLIHI